MANLDGRHVHHHRRAPNPPPRHGHDSRCGAAPGSLLAPGRPDCAAGTDLVGYVRLVADDRPTLSPAERAAAGKEARAAVPRRSHGRWKPQPDRADPIDVLLAQARTRVPELVPIRH